MRLDWNFLKKSACDKVGDLRRHSGRFNSIKATMLPMMAIQATQVVGGSLKPALRLLGAAVVVFILIFAKHTCFRMTN